MRVDLRTYRPELCASPRMERPHLAYVWLEIDSTGLARLAATDSYIACAVPCEVDKADRPGPIPVQAFADARARASRKRHDKFGNTSLAAMRCSARWVHVAAGNDLPAVAYARPRIDNFPDLDKAANTMTGPSDEASLPVTFGLNPQLVHRLGRALGCDHRRGRYLRLELNSSHKAIRVTTSADDGEWGILMPVRIA